LLKKLQFVIEFVKGRVYNIGTPVHAAIGIGRPAALCETQLGAALTNRTDRIAGDQQKTSRRPAGAGEPRRPRERNNTYNCLLAEIKYRGGKDTY